MRWRFFERQSKRGTHGAMQQNIWNKHEQTIEFQVWIYISKCAISSEYSYISFIDIVTVQIPVCKMVRQF